MGQKLEECFHDFHTFVAIYKEAQIKDSVIDTLISLTTKQANPWNRDNESRNAILKGLSDEELTRAYNGVGREFGSDDFKTICDKIRAINPHVQAQSGKTEQAAEAKPNILKSELEMDLEKK